MYLLGCENTDNTFLSSVPLVFSVSYFSGHHPIILSGRSHEFNAQQQLDFEIIKRQFSNVADIMTYDDLLNRVYHIIGMLKKDKQA